MDLNDIRSLVTLAGLLLFVALLVWTWRPGRQAAHAEAAQLPFEGDAESGAEPGGPGAPR